VNYDVVIGLEVHAQLTTRTKMFCGCATTFGAAPNTQTCPICQGMPGTLPVLNRRAVEYAIRSALALNCHVNPACRFARKHYFYPDMPKNFQISQYEEPLAEDGWLEFDSNNVLRRVRIQRLHLEEDVGKLVHEGTLETARTSLVDYNRAGVPLMETVTRPDIQSPEEAADFLRVFRAVLVHLGVCDGNMEEGSLRCDANVSLKRPEANNLGTKVEIKNLNSFRNVQEALAFEIERQRKALDEGKPIVQETRLWDADRGYTLSMRTKELAHDYRYFPEPDLVPIKPDEEKVDVIRQALPELPRVRRLRFIKSYGLPPAAAEVLTQNRALADYYEAAVREFPQPKLVSNWVTSELLRELGGDDERAILQATVTPSRLAGLLRLIDDGTISGKIAKTVFDTMVKTGEEAATIVRREGLIQIADTSALSTLVDEAIAANPKAVSDFHRGKEVAAKALVGQVIKASGGKANPAIVSRLVTEKLAQPIVSSVAEPWWRRLRPGRPILCAFVSIRRSVPASEPLDGAIAQTLYRQYVATIESAAREMNAALPLHWEGDLVTLFFANEDDQPAAIRAFKTARTICDRLVQQRSNPRIAIDASHLLWNSDTAKLRHPAVDQCRIVSALAPLNAVLLSDEVLLMLSPAVRSEVSAFGATADGTSMWIFPHSTVESAAAAGISAAEELLLWDRVRSYSCSDEIRRLRYVGLQLTKKEPPSLDIEEVFVAPDVSIRERRSATLSAAGKTSRRRNADVFAELSRAPFGQLPQDEKGLSRPFSEVFKEKRGLIVLGDPGSGKTTLLRWLAVVAATGSFAMARHLGVAERLLPLPVSVGRLSEVRQTVGNAASVPDTLARYFHDRKVGDEGELRSFLRRQLQNGNCLLLLDGLDEVQPELREDVRAWLEAFAARHPENRFIVSSRSVGYTGFDLAESAVITLRPFDQPQVRRYVEAFTRAYRRWENTSGDSASAADEPDQLLKALEHTPRLAALARNPFMLSALALINRAEGRLPRHRVQFYELFARALCETWGRARRIVAPPPQRGMAFEEEAVPILGELARAMHQSYPGGVAPEPFVLHTLAGALMSKQRITRDEATEVARNFLRRAAEESQLLLERGAGWWGFLHLTFQEFFAAVGLHAADQFESTAVQHLTDSRWTEIVRLGVGHLALVQHRSQAAQKFVTRVIAHRATGPLAPAHAVLRKHIPLAALLAADGGETLSERLRDRVASDVTRWILQMAEPVWTNLMRELSLAEFGRVVAAKLKENISTKNSLSRANVAAALGVIGDDGAIAELINATEDPSVEVRHNALLALGRLRIAEGESAIVRGLADKTSSVRSHAATALANLRPANAVSALVNLLQDADPMVRAAATDALATVQDETAFPALLTALRDAEEVVRKRATNSMAILAPDAALAVFLENAVDPDPGVRSAAVAGLGLLRTDAVLPALSDALGDPDVDVRVEAIDALATLPSEHAQRIARRALEDQAPKVRLRALTMLGRGGEIPEREVHAGVEAALSATDHSERIFAAMLLAIDRVPVGIAILQEGLDEVEPVDRFLSAALLGILRIEDAQPLLLRRLDDSHEIVRFAAANSLGLQRAKIATDALIGKLRDESPLVRSTAAGSLGKIGGQAALRALIRYARNAGTLQERAAAVAALMQLTETRAGGRRRAKTVKARR